jgi:hypothetical protein
MRIDKGSALRTFIIDWSSLASARAVAMSPDEGRCMLDSI